MSYPRVTCYVQLQASNSWEKNPSQCVTWTPGTFLLVHCTWHIWIIFILCHRFALTLCCASSQRDRVVFKRLASLLQWLVIWNLVSAVVQFYPVLTFWLLVCLFCMCIFLLLLFLSTSSLYESTTLSAGFRLINTCSTEYLVLWKCKLCVEVFYALCINMFYSFSHVSYMYT